MRAIINDGNKVFSIEMQLSIRSAMANLNKETCFSKEVSDGVFDMFGDELLSEYLFSIDTNYQNYTPYFRN